MNHLLAAKGCRGGRHGWRFGRPSSGDPCILAAVIRVSRPSHVVEMLSGTSKAGKLYTRSMVQGEFVFATAAQLEAFVDFVGALVNQRQLGFHHDNGMVTFAQFSKTVPYTVVPSGTAAISCTDTYLQPAGVVELAAGDLAYVSFTVDTQYQNKVQCTLKSVCKIGACYTDIYDSD